MSAHRSQRAKYRDIKSYNLANPKNIIRPLVVVIDEYADLVSVLSKRDREDFERTISRMWPTTLDSHWPAPGDVFRAVEAQFRPVVPGDTMQTVRLGVSVHGDDTWSDTAAG